MSEKKTSNLLTAGKVAELLGVSPGKVKKAIEELKIEPASKKGACSYYDDTAVKKIKDFLK